MRLNDAWRDFLRHKTERRFVVDVQDCDALAIGMESKKFRAPNFDALKSVLKNPLIFDGRNMYVPEQMRQRGFEYDTIGRR